MHCSFVWPLRYTVIKSAKATSLSTGRLGHKSCTIQGCKQWITEIPFTVIVMLFPVLTVKTLKRWNKSLACRLKAFFKPQDGSLLFFVAGLYNFGKLIIAEQQYSALFWCWCKQLLLKSASRYLYKHDMQCACWIALHATAITNCSDTLRAWKDDAWDQTRIWRSLISFSVPG